MNTTKILIAAVLVLVTGATYAQSEKGLIAMERYSLEINRFETWAADNHDRTKHENFYEGDLPIISTTYYVDFVDISYEIPSENMFFEEGPHMEPWMKELFETEESQEELRLEEWMFTPFETLETIPMEGWMASNW